MTGAGGERSSDMAGAKSAEKGRVSFLDQALWKRFNEARDPEAFADAWLALQCRMIPGAARGVVVLGEPDSGPFAPAAYWPDPEAGAPDLEAAADLAIAERRGVVRGAEGDDGGVATLAYPLIVEERLYGVIAIETGRRTAQQLRAVMRQLQWGTSWMEVLLRREQAHDEREHLTRTTTALDLVAAALEEEGFRSACNKLAIELATRLDCDQVSIGFLRRDRVVVVALSHAAQFGQRMNLIRDIGAAMDEAVDQRDIVVFPADPGAEYRVTRAHAELVRSHDAGSILTVPLEVDGRTVGAIAFERPPGAGFDQATIELCDSIAAVLGPLLEIKRRNDRHILMKLGAAASRQMVRLFGPKYVGRKLALLLAVSLTALFAVARGDYRITSPAIVEGMVQRVIVAPFDGYIASEHARAGGTVRKEQALATLDDKDLTLEHLRWSTTRRQRLTEYNRALAERDRADINIIRAQIDQAAAQMALLEEQITRTKLKAPFEGIVVSGDLSQSIGAAVKRGDELFRIAPLAAYRVILEVDESEIADIAERQQGTLLVASLPNSPLPYTVKLITPISEAREGRNYFRVEARLDAANPRLRPGMEGVAKTHVDRRLLIRVWTYKLVNWLRLTFWALWP